MNHPIRDESRGTLIPASTTFWILIGLRYRLLWAQARTAAGKTALFLVLYLVGGLLALALTLGGTGAALAALSSGCAEGIVRGLLAVASAGAIVAGLTLGTGPRTAFAVPILRRYPMSPRRLFVARHITGFLEPTWILLSALATGVATGFAVSGSRTILAGLPATILCVVASYIAALILSAVVDRILIARGGTTLLGASAFILSAATCFAGPFLVTSDHRAWWRVPGRILIYTPPGCAATVLAGEKAVVGACALIAWCVALAAVLAELERRRPQWSAAAPPAVKGECFYDAVEGLFGEQSGPLVSKSLRYYLRSNRTRFNLAISVPMMVFLPRLMSRNSGAEAAFLLTLALFFCGGVIATSTTTLNQFGFDGSGIRRYYLMPVPLVRVLQAGSTASLLVGGTAILPGLVLWAFTAGPDLELRKVLMLLSSGIAGLLVFNALGIWTTVVEPRRLDFRSVAGNQLSASGNLAVFGGLSLALGAAFILNATGRCNAVLGLWWLLPLSAVCCSVVYVLSLRAVRGFLNRRREGLAEILAGENTN